MSKEHWGIAEWLENDPKGLQELQRTNPIRFEQLNASYFDDIGGSSSGTSNHQAQTAPLAQNGSNATLGKEHWGIAEWLENDPKGLQELQRTNPIKFEQLNASYFDGIGGSSSGTSNYQAQTAPLAQNGGNNHSMPEIIQQQQSHVHASLHPKSDMVTGVWLGVDGKPKRRGSKGLSYRIDRH